MTRSTYLPLPIGPAGLARIPATGQGALGLVLRGPLVLHGRPRPRDRRRPVRRERDARDGLLGLRRALHLGRQRRSVSRGLVHARTLERVDLEVEARLRVDHEVEREDGLALVVERDRDLGRRSGRDLRRIGLDLDLELVFEVLLRLVGLCVRDLARGLRQDGREIRDVRASARHRLLVADVVLHRDRHRRVGRRQHGMLRRGGIPSVVLGGVVDARGVVGREGLGARGEHRGEEERVGPAHGGRHGITARHRQDSLPTPWSKSRPPRRKLLPLSPGHTGLERLETPAPHA